MILCDTNILIEFYKDNEDVSNALRAIGLPDLAVSVITIGELYFGARDKRELLKMKSTWQACTKSPLTWKFQGVIYPCSNHMP